MLLLISPTDMQKSVKSHMNKKKPDFHFIINTLKEKNLKYSFQSLFYFHLCGKYATIKLFLLHYTS